MSFCFHGRPVDPRPIGGDHVARVRIESPEVVSSSIPNWASGFRFTVGQYIDEVQSPADRVIEIAFVRLPPTASGVNAALASNSTSLNAGTAPSPAFAPAKKMGFPPHKAPAEFDRTTGGVVVSTGA